MKEIEVNTLVRFRGNICKIIAPPGSSGMNPRKYILFRIDARGVVELADREEFEPLSPLEQLL